VGRKGICSVNLRIESSKEMIEKSQITFWERQVEPDNEKTGNWDFKQAQTQALTHGLHPYPARMIPQIAGRLMEQYLSVTENALVADVFCGSGTVNVEASLRGYRSIGIDINPFAVLLARAKVMGLEDIGILNKIRNRLERKIDQFEHGFPKLAPKYKNLEHWFKPEVIDKLTYLKYAIHKVRRTDIRTLLWITFANTIMKCSNVDWKSSRYIRVYPEERLRIHKPDVFRYFTTYLLDAVNRIRSYSERKMVDAIVLQGDARRLPLKDNCIDIIITSPPYGEERNTIPYMRWSKLFLLWLGLKDTEINALEKQALGGSLTKLNGNKNIPSPTFWRSVRDIPDQRLAEALPFMTDYMTVLKEMARVLKPGARCCIVIGHRSVNRQLLDMGTVTKEMAVKAGFLPEETYLRSIPKKMIPWTTPTGDTIFDESIVVLRRRK
jgi:site-specific DNA-methyltransferase (cytosine-N4-specific)